MFGLGHHNTTTTTSFLSPLILFGGGGGSSKIITCLNADIMQMTHVTPPVGSREGNSPFSHEGRGRGGKERGKGEGRVKRQI